MKLEIKFSSRLGRILSLKTVWQCHVGQLIFENLAKGPGYVFVPYGSLMYPLKHSEGGLDPTSLV